MTATTSSPTAASSTTDEPATTPGRLLRLACATVGAPKYISWRELMGWGIRSSITEFNRVANFALIGASLGFGAVLGARLAHTLFG